MQFCVGTFYINYDTRPIVKRNKEKVIFLLSDTMQVKFETSEIEINAKIVI